MRWTRLFGTLLSYFFLSVPVLVFSEDCTVFDKNLRDSKAKHANSCSLPVKDCDLVNGLWYCSSEKINSGHHATDELSHTTFTSNTSNQLVTSAPVDNSDCVDNDGDGWGWDGVCLLYTSPSPRDATLSRMPSSA